MKKNILTFVILFASYIVFSQQDSDISKIYLKDKRVLQGRNLSVAANFLNYINGEGNSVTIDLQKIERIEGFEFYPDVKIQSLSSDDFNKTQLLNSFSDGSTIGKYFDVHNNSYKKGDTLIIGKPSGISSNFNQYSGLTSRLFETIIFGTASGTLLKGIRFAEEFISGEKIIIDKILLDKKNRNVFLVTIPINPRLLPIDKYLTVILLEKSLSTKEIINPRAKLTRETAIELLKEKKELLDLGLISKEEYESLRNELAPIILNK